MEIQAELNHQEMELSAQVIHERFGSLFPSSEGDGQNEEKKVEKQQEGKQQKQQEGEETVVDLLDQLIKDEEISWSVLAGEVLKSAPEKVSKENDGHNYLSPPDNNEQDDFFFFLKCQALIDWHCYGIVSKLVVDEKAGGTAKYRLFRKGSNKEGHGLKGDDYLHLNAIMRLHHLICALKFYTGDDALYTDLIQGGIKEPFVNFISKNEKALSEKDFNQKLHDDLKKLCPNKGIAFKEQVGKSKILNILKILGAVLYPKLQIFTEVNSGQAKLNERSTGVYHAVYPITKKTDEQKGKIDEYIRGLEDSTFEKDALRTYQSLIEDDTRALGAQARKRMPETLKNGWLVQLHVEDEEPILYFRHGALACESVTSSDGQEATRSVLQMRQYVKGNKAIHGLNLNTRVGPCWSVVDSIFGLNDGQNTMINKSEAAFGRENFTNIGQNFFAAWTGYYFLSTENNDYLGKKFDGFSYLFFIDRILYFPVYIGSLIDGYAESDLPSSSIEAVQKNIWIAALCDAVFILVHAGMAYLGPLRRRLGEIAQKKAQKIHESTKFLAIACASGLDRTGGLAYLFEEYLLGKGKNSSLEVKHCIMLASTHTCIANFSSPGSHGVKKTSDLGIIPGNVKGFLYNKKPSSKNKEPKLPATLFKKFFADNLAIAHFLLCISELVIFYIRYSDDAHSHDYFEILNTISDELVLLKSAVLLCFHAAVSQFSFDWQSMFLQLSLIASILFYGYFLLFKGGEYVEEILPVVATLLCGPFQSVHTDLMSAPCEAKVDNPARREEVSQALNLNNETLFGLAGLVWDPLANHFFVRCTEFDSHVFVLAVMTLNGEGMSLTNPLLNLTGFCGADPWPVVGEVMCDNRVQSAGLLPCDVMSNATDPQDVQGFKNAVVWFGGSGSGATMVWSEENFAFLVDCSQLGQQFFWLNYFYSLNPHYQLNATEVLVEGACPQQGLPALTF